MSKKEFLCPFDLVAPLCKIVAMKRNVTCYSETSQDFGLKNISPSKLLK